MCKNAEEWMAWISRKACLSEYSVPDCVQHWLVGQEQGMCFPCFLFPDTGHQHFKDYQRFGLNALAMIFTSFFSVLYVFSLDFLLT